MMVAEFFFFLIALGFQEGLGFFEGFRLVDVEVEIAEFPVLGHRIAGGEADALEKNTGDAVLLKKGDCVPGEGVDLIVILHHIFRLLEHRGIKGSVPKARQDKGNGPVLFREGGKGGLLFLRDGAGKRSIVFKTASDKL